MTIRARVMSRRCQVSGVRSPVRCWTIAHCATTVSLHRMAASHRHIRWSSTTRPDQSGGAAGTPAARGPHRRACKAAATIGCERLVSDAFNRFGHREHASRLTELLFLGAVCSDHLTTASSLRAARAARLDPDDFALPCSADLNGSAGGLPESDSITVVVYEGAGRPLSA